MKKIKNLVIALFLAFTFIVADLAAAPVTAQAAGTLKFAKSITMLKGVRYTSRTKSNFCRYVPSRQPTS